MPAPSLAFASSPARLIARFGGLAIPGSGATQAFVDLNDTVNWSVHNVAMGADNRKVQLDPLLYRARGVYVADDWGPTLVVLSGLFAETNGVTRQSLMAPIQMAGEQYLTFDNNTYLLAKLKGAKTPTLVRKFSPFLWAYELEFICREPWHKDFQSSGSLPNLLNPNGGFEGAAVTPTLLDSRTIVQSNDFETAPATVDYGHSLGTEALGTLAAWTQVTGVWSIASNVVTAPATAGAIMVTGHPDMGNSGNAQTYYLRFNWVTGSQPRAILNYVNSTNYIFAQADGTNLTIQKVLAGVTTSVATVAAALTTGNWYWFAVAQTGNAFTAQIFTDSPAGTRSVTQVGTNATFSFTFGSTDAAIAYGQIGIGAGAATSSTFGGAFTNVCYVTGPAPTGWTTNTGWATNNEAWYCWSNKQAYYGTHSLSIWHPIGGAFPGWNGPTFSISNTVTNQYSVRILTTGTATGNLTLTGQTSGPSVTSGGWKTSAFSWSATLASTQLVCGTNSGPAGTMYYDYVAAITAATPSNVLFRSLGTDATGTLNAWTSVGGTFTISGNVVTAPTIANTLLYGGHADWTDSYVFCRVIATPNSNNSGVMVRVQNVASTATYTGYFAQIDAAGTLSLQKVTAGPSFAGLGTQTITGGRIAGSAYWIKLSAVGTTITATAFNDAAGYPGDQVANVTVTDATYTQGVVALECQYASGAAPQWGGPYSNVCIVQGNTPTGWTPSATWTTSEPAFAWSKVSPYAGTYSGSIYIPPGQSTWSASWAISGTASAGTAAYGAYVKQTTGDLGTASVAWSAGSTNAGTPNSAYALVTGATASDGAAHNLICKLLGAGTAYFDSAALQGTVDSVTGLYVGDTYPQVATPGSTGGGTATNFTITYNGTVWAEPQWQFNIPVSSNVSQVKLNNSTSGEIITITFANPLTAATTLTIDSGAFTVTDQNAVQYDFSGSFPMLYPGANAMVATVVSSSGTPSVTLDESYTKRYAGWGA